jgi:hypothetical protein
VTERQSIHWEYRPGFTACGRPVESVSVTDVCSEFEEREGSRCKSCWRRIKARRQWKEFGK